MPGRAPPATGRAAIGIPAALGLYGQLPLWKSFFSELGIPFVTSEGFDAGINLGREVQGAEFCAPLAALHGHVKYLADKADWIFLPVLMEESRPGTNNAARLLLLHAVQLRAGLGRAGRGPPRALPHAPGKLDAMARAHEARAVRVPRQDGTGTCRREAGFARAFERASAAYDKAVRLLQERFLRETALAGDRLSCCSAVRTTCCPPK